jgi:hypothetical protein
VLVRRLAPLLAGAILLAGCGGQDEKPAEPVPAKSQSVGKRSAGSVVQFADCNDWNRGTRAEREATVRELRDQLTTQGSRSTRSPLSDERAYKVLQKACTATDYAGSLRLYKLYARVQGFAPLAE